MMDLYECSKKHNFLRAAAGKEEPIPCAFCECLARFVATVDELTIGGNGHGLQPESSTTGAAET